MDGIFSPRRPIHLISIHVFICAVRSVRFRYNALLLISAEDVYMADCAGRWQCMNEHEYMEKSSNAASLECSLKLQGWKSVFAFAMYIRLATSASTV